MENSDRGDTKFLEARLRSLCQEHDWLWMYSDDPRVAKQGRFESGEIDRLAEYLGEVGSEIVAEFAPRA